jgi:AraC family transcriptional regulator
MIDYRCEKGRPTINECSNDVRCSPSSHEPRIRRCSHCAADPVFPHDGAGKRTLSATLQGGLSGWQLRQQKQYIEKSLALKILVPDMAARAGLSTGHFGRAFRLSVGQTPHEYIRRQRIIRAQALMITSDQSLACIALEVGFCDQAHLAKVFSRLVGMTANAWRRDARSSVTRAQSAQEARPTIGLARA